MGYKLKFLILQRVIIRLSGITIKDKKNMNGDVEIKITGLKK